MSDLCYAAADIVLQHRERELVAELKRVRERIVLNAEWRRLGLPAIAAFDSEAYWKSAIRGFK